MHNLNVIHPFIYIKVYSIKPTTTAEMFSCCRANPKAVKKDKDKHKKGDEGNNDDKETNEINETAEAATPAPAVAELKPSETEKETQTETEREVKPNGNLTAKSIESPIETEDNAERIEEQIDQTGIHNKQQYIYSIYSLRIS